MAMSSQNYIQNESSISDGPLDLEMESTIERREKLRDEQYSEFINAAKNPSWYDRFLQLCQCLPEDYFHAKRYARELLMSFPSMRRHTLVVYVNGSTKLVNDILGSSYHARRRWKMAFTIIRASFELRYRARLAKHIIGESGYNRFFKSEPVQTRKNIEEKFNRFGKGKSFQRQETEMHKFNVARERVQKLRNFWVSVIYFSCMIYVFSIPLELAFASYPESQTVQFFSAVNIVIDLLWVLDLWKYFFTINNLSSGNFYRRSGVNASLLADLYSALPWHRILDSQLNGLQNFWSIAGFLSMMRIFKLFTCNYINPENKTTMGVRWQKDLAQLTLVSFAVIHSYGCLFFDCTVSDGSLPMLYGDRYQFSNAYQDSLYVSVLILTGSSIAGNQFSSAQNSTMYSTNFKWLLAIGSILHYLLLTYTVAYITNLYLAVTSSTQELDKQKNELEAYMEYRRLPPRTKEMLRKCYALKWSNQRYFDEEKVLKNLTSHTRKQVLKYTNAEALLNVPFLRNTSERFRNKLVYRMQEYTYGPGQSVANGGSKATSIRFILHGAVEFRDTNGNVILTLGENTYFGDEHLFVKDSVQPCDIVTIVGCRMYALTRTSFVTVLSDFPEYQRSIVQWGNERRKCIPINTRLSMFSNVEDEDYDDSTSSEESSSKEDEEQKELGDDNKVGLHAEEVVGNGKSSKNEDSYIDTSGSIYEDSVSGQIKKLHEITEKLNNLLILHDDKAGGAHLNGAKNRDTVLSMLRPSNMKPQTLRPIPPNEQNTMSYTNNEQYGGYSIAENDDDDEYTIS